jgi:hypothetical protein
VFGYCGHVHVEVSISQIHTCFCVGIHTELAHRADARRHCLLHRRRPHARRRSWRLHKRRLLGSGHEPRTALEFGRGNTFARVLRANHRFHRLHRRRLLGSGHEPRTALEFGRGNTFARVLRANRRFHRLHRRRLLGSGHEPRTALEFGRGNTFAPVLRDRGLCLLPGEQHTVDLRLRLQPRQQVSVYQRVRLN